MVTGSLALLVVAIDRIVKIYASNALKPLSNAKPLLPGVVELVYAENTGMAFGLMQGGTVLLSAVTLLALVIAFIALKRYQLSLFVKISLGLALGGAVGNLIDRVLTGYVVDMFNFQFVRFAVFNVADAAITVGMVLLIANLLFLPHGFEKKA